MRGGGARDGVVSVVLFGDYHCPYCRNLGHVLARLRQVLGERLLYVFRHFPNERAHPGAETARARVGSGRRAGPLLGDARPALRARTADRRAAALRRSPTRWGSIWIAFGATSTSDAARERVAEDLADGRRNGVTGTPTLFVNGLRYDGAWDFYSLLEALEAPVAARVQRSARVFASLPAAGGLVLLLAAAAALVCANSPLAPYYRLFVESSFDIGPPGRQLSLTVGDWFSEGLLAIFFLVVGLEIRREMTVGTLASRRAALLPVVAAVGGVVVPAALYLAINSRAERRRMGGSRPPPTSRSRSASWRCWGAGFRQRCASSSRRWPWWTTSSRC